VLGAQTETESCLKTVIPAVVRVYL
jgi:hypothetical protein